MTLVDNNLRHFPPDAWKCLLLGNAQRSDYPTSRCDVSVHPHTMWGEILHINSPRIKEYDCERIMLVLDDVNLQGLNVAKLIHFADRRKADMVSPRVLSASHPWMYDTTAIQSFNTGNSSLPRPWFDPFGLLWGKAGHEQRHRYLEIYATLFNSRRAWPVFEKLLAMVRPGYGWGYDWCMGKHLKQFIDASQTVSHAGQPKGPKSENGLGAQIEMKALQDEFDIIMAGCDSAVAGIAGRAV